MRELFFDEKLGETRRNSGGVRAARAERGVRAVGGVEDGVRWEKLGGTLRHSETLGETRSEGGDGGLKVGKERVVHFFWVGLIY